MPFDNIDWNAARNQVAKEDLYYPHPLIQVHSPAPARTHTQTHTLHTFTHTLHTHYTHSYTHYTHSHTHTHTHTYTHSHTHAHTLHTFTHTHTHTHYTHSHTHTGHHSAPSSFGGCTCCTMGGVIASNRQQPYVRLYGALACRG